MTNSHSRSFRLPLEHELGQHRITNSSGVEIGVLPNGCVFAIEHALGEERTLLNQVFGSPLGSGIGRLLLRVCERDDACGEGNRPAPPPGYAVAQSARAFMALARRVGEHLVRTR